MLEKLNFTRISEAKDRVAKYYKGEKTDKIPFTFTPTHPTAGKCWMQGCDYDFEQMIKDKQCFLEGNIASMVWQSEQFPDCDYLPVFKTHIFGEGFIPSMFGAEQLIVKHSPPFIEGRILKDITEIDKLPERIDPDTQGWGSMVRESLEYAVEKTHGKVPVMITDHQSPYGIATKLLGNEELILAMYDEPELVHKLMNICADATIDTANALIKWLGRENVVLNGNCPVVGEGGIILWDDYISVLNPAMHTEFCAPANKKVYDYFGNGHLHTCGPYFPRYIEAFLACKPVSMDISSMRALTRPRADMMEFRRITKENGIKLCGGISTCETSIVDGKHVQPDFEWLKFMADGGLLWSEGGNVEQGKIYSEWVERLAKEGF